MITELTQSGVAELMQSGLAELMHPGVADVVQTGLSSWWAPALAFAAGVLSFASPCVFPLVPGYLSFVAGGEDRDERKPIVPILLFIAGFAVVFTAVGASVSALRLIKDSTGQRIAGAVIVVFGLLMLLYAFRVGWTALYSERRPFLSRLKPGRASAMPLGMAFAAGWTPCIGPVLGGILAIAGGQGGAVRGGLLLLIYSLGLGVPFLLVGLGVRKLLGALNWVKRNYHWIAGVSGAAMIAIGILLVTGQWQKLLLPFIQWGNKLNLPI